MKKSQLAALAALLASSGIAFADPATTLFHYSFENSPPTSALQWEEYDAPLPAQHVASGGGLLGVPSSQGGFHYETYHSNSYAPYGSGGYGYFGVGDLNGNPVHSGDFYEAIDIYVDLDTWTPPAANDRAFTIDSSPGVVASALPGANGNEYGAEQQFGIYVPSVGTVQVEARNPQNVGTTIFATITESGWYTFVLTFRKSGNLTTDPVLSDYFVYDTDKLDAGLRDDALVGSVMGMTSTFASEELGGSNYIWLPLWQENFADNVLAIDNLRVGLGTLPLPEPASLALLGVGGLMMLRRRRV